LGEVADGSLPTCLPAFGLGFGGIGFAAAAAALLLLAEAAAARQCLSLSSSSLSLWVLTLPSPVCVLALSLLLLCCARLLRSFFLYHSRLPRQASFSPMAERERYQCAAVPMFSWMMRAAHGASGRLARHFSLLFSFCWN
jgi:hypothetical protein